MHAHATAAGEHIVVEDDAEWGLVRSQVALETHLDYTMGVGQWS